MYSLNFCTVLNDFSTSFVQKHSIFVFLCLSRYMRAQRSSERASINIRRVSRRSCPCTVRREFGPPDSLHLGRACMTKWRRVCALLVPNERLLARMGSLCHLSRLKAVVRWLMCCTIFDRKLACRLSMTNRREFSVVLHLSRFRR